MKIDQKKSNLIDLAEEIKTTALTAKEEEQEYLDSNLKAIKGEIDSIESKLPYPEVQPYDVAHDYDEISFLQYKKAQNKKYWDELDRVNPYYNADPLYVGHLQLQGQSEYYLMDNLLKTKKLSNGALLIATMDKEFDEIRRIWRFPKEKSGVLFSRNVSIKKSKVENVELIFDTSNKLVSSISDSYLRNALIRNKQQAGIVSIIQTIQEKQDKIMTTSLSESFIVQGCAGSGKTVILLNRLRYLIFNKMLSKKYSILVPSEQFKSFILSAVLKYGINADYIYTYREYYSKLLSSRSNQTADESVFSQDFLVRVYSENLIKECYDDLAKVIYEKVESLIDYCEGKINALVEKAREELAEEQIVLKEKYGSEILECITPIKVLLPEIDYEQIEPKQILSSAKLFLGNALQKYNAERARIFSLNFMITESEVEKHDKSIVELKEEMQDAKEKASKSNIFTRAFRYRKLSKIREEYDIKYKEIEEKLIAKKREDMLNKDLDVLENGLTIDEFKNGVREIENIVDKFEGLLETNSKQLSEPEIYVKNKYKKEGDLLTEFLEYFEGIKNIFDDKIKQLLTGKDVINELFVRAKLLYDTFFVLDVMLNKKGKKAQKDDIKIFAHQDVREVYGYFQMTLMAKCKSILAKEFNVKLNEGYKHYSFLSLYFAYLVKGEFNEPSKYIFIDEAQDLSKAELNLIYKLNNKPILNFFGDINQVITEHGVNDWGQIEYISKKYILDENFRNTNQVVDYCNSSLPSSMKMKKIGVSMDPVDIFDTMEIFIYSIKDLSEYSIIVKDEVAKSDLSLFFKGKNIVHNNIFTVKEVKGLEFYKIIVISRDMTYNEKYIAYTRSLNKLIEVKKLPHWDLSEKVNMIVEEN